MKSLSSAESADKPGGRTWNRTRNTGIFKLTSLPLMLCKSHEYCTLAEMVEMGDGGNVEIYTRWTSFRYQRYSGHWLIFNESDKSRPIAVSHMCSTSSILGKW
jgi:hypothetical protein